MPSENNDFHKTIQSNKIILAALFVTTISLQIAAALSRSFWEDEALTGWLITKGFSGLINNLHVEFNPPLYWIIVFFWSKVFGTSELGIRSFSIVCWVTTSWLTHKVAKELFDKKVALVATGLLTFSPLVLTYASNARYYSIAAALTLLLILVMYKYISTNSRLYLVIYVLVGTVLIYTIYFGAIVLLAINLWWFAQWVRSNRAFLSLIKWALVQGMILVFYIPWISTLMTTLYSNFPSKIGGSNWLTGIFLRAGYIGYAYGVGEFFSPLNPVAWIGIIIVAGLIVYAIIKGKHLFWLPVVILVVVVVVSIGVNLVGHITVSYWQNLPNRTFFIYPLFVIILAYGIIKLKDKWMWGILSILLVVYSVGIFNYFSEREVIKPILTVPWREIMSNIRDQSNPNAVVICTNEDFACSYYQEQYGYKAFSPANWEQLSVQKPSEIWWIQSNLSNDENFTDASHVAFISLQTQYQETGVFNYSPQDKGIAMLKSRVLGYRPFQFRVVTYRFVLP